MLSSVHLVLRRLLLVPLHCRPRALDNEAYTGSDNSSKVIVTTSKPGAFPSPLSLKHHSQVQAVDPENIRTDATIKETCPNCGRDEVRYYTQQLRSADEGSTVFYNCECGHKYATSIESSPYSCLITSIDGLQTTKSTPFLHVSRPC